MRDICKELQELADIIGLMIVYVPAKEHGMFIGIQLYEKGSTAEDAHAVEICKHPDDANYAWSSSLVHCAVYDDSDFSVMSREQMAEYAFGQLSGSYVSKKTSKQLHEIVMHLPEFETLSEFKLKWAVKTGE